MNGQVAEDLDIAEEGVRALSETSTISLSSPPSSGLTLSISDDENELVDEVQIGPRSAEVAQWPTLS